MNQPTITRRMNDAWDSLGKELNSLCDRSCFTAVLNELAEIRESMNKSRRPSVLKKLFDLFDACGIAYVKGMDDAYYEKLVREADLPSFDQLEAKVLNALYSKYDIYPSPEQFMERIVRRLSSEEDHWENDPLRLQILKRFVKYGDYLRRAKFGSRKFIRDYAAGKLGEKNTKDNAAVADCLEDDIFDTLASVEPARRKPEGTHGLLKLADDLAGGKFRAEGATKKGLYCFAIVYNMTYGEGKDEAGNLKRPVDDVEVNLFRDYYANNLMRFITDAYHGKTSDFERDPSGQGVNYKNFAEMILLYYLCKTDMQPDKKIEKAFAMIDERLKASKNALQRDASDMGTKAYRSLFTEDILRLPEDRFEAFIAENYAPQFGVGLFQQQAEQNSAHLAYTKLLAGLEKMGYSPESCNYGLWFTDTADSAFRNKLIETLSAGTEGEAAQKEKKAAFAELLVSMDQYLRKLEPVVPGKMTRTRLITAYYYYFNAANENSLSNRCRAFKSFYHSFEQGIRQHLIDAGYQPFSSRNLLDVLVAFSAYAYMNI